MQEGENEVLTAKADPAPEAAPKPKNRRALWIVLAVLGACLLLGMGAVVGGGAVYGLTRARSRAYVPPSVERWVVPREMPHQEWPGVPGRGTIVLGTGALIVEVVPDGPAERAGLREGDWIVAVEGKALDAENDLATLIGRQAPGDEVTLEVAALGRRMGQETRKLTVTLGENPDDEGAAYLGVQFVSMPDQEYGPGRGTFPFHGCDDEDEDLGSLRERLFRCRLPRR